MTTVAVFDCDHQSQGSQPEHKKPTPTEIARKLNAIHIHVRQVRQNLSDIDRMLDEAHKIIHDLEETSK